MPLIPPNPINANTYLPGVQVIPAAFLITNITRSFPMVVSTGNNPEIEAFISNFPSLNLLTGLVTTSTLVPGSLIIRGSGGTIWTDPGADGILVRNFGAPGTVDYTTGIITGPNLNISGTFSYFPNFSFVQPPDTYVVSQNIRLDVPITYGMPQADALIGTILEINGTDFSLDIDSNNFDWFKYPGTGIKITRPASFSPAGSRNLSYSNSTSQVAFQNLNNIGN